MTTRRTVAVVVGLLVVAGMASYWYYAPTPAAPQGKAGFFRKKAGPGNSADPVPVLAIDARVADVPVYIDGVGTARALNTVTVRAQVEGKLMAVLFTEGQDVPKGYVVAKIDPATYQAAFDQTVAKKAQDEAQLANAKLDLERYTRLAATNAVNKQQLDTQRALVTQLEAQVKLDQAAMDNARAILSYTDIVAPIAGRTGIRLVDAGNLVRGAEATGIVILTQLRPISVFFSLPQQNLPELTKGMAEGQLPLDALTADGKGALDKGKVTVIDNQVDQTTGTVKLRAEFPNNDLQLWPGQFVNVRVLIDTLRQVVVVPTAAIQRGPNGTFVYVLKEGDTVSVRPVTLTQQDDTRAVISDGVKAQEQVVTTGFTRLSNGTRVAVQSSEGEPKAAEATGQTPPAVPPEGRRKREGGTEGDGKERRRRSENAPAAPSAKQ